MRLLPSRRPGARVETIVHGTDINLVNLADRRRANPGDRIIEIHDTRLRATAMVLCTIEEGQLVVDVYDTAGPVQVRTR